MTDKPIAEVLIDRWTHRKENTKQIYLDKLNEGGIWVVEFTKVDGTESVMHVTLDPTLVPPAEPLKEGKTPRPEQDHLIHAFSTDRSGWRSFTVANVQKFYKLQ